MVRVMLCLCLLLYPGWMLLAAAAGWVGQMRPANVLAFVSYRRDNYDIFVVDVAAGVEAPLTRHPAQETDFTWSPDGQFIAFVSTHNSRAGLYRMQANGRLIGRIPSSRNPVSVRWSPDGSQIAFLGGQIRDVYVIPAEGGTARNVTLTPSQEVNFAWSPDGRYIAASYMDEANVLVVDVAQGRHQSLITDGHLPGWSPDSRQIAYRILAENTPLIGIKNLDNSRLSDISTENGKVAWYAPAWSPDSQTLAYLITHNAHYLLRLVALSSGAVRDIPTGFEAMGAPLWSPDGTLLAFSGKPVRGKMGIYILEFDSSLIRLVSDSGMLPAWKPG